MDKQIPLSVKKLLAEAQGCLDNDFLTGASACVRLSVIEFADLQDIDATNHDERLNTLKEKTSTTPHLFDELIAIHLSELDESSALSYDGWSKSQLVKMLNLLDEIITTHYARQDL